MPVNAWENSLFHASENKAEVALSLLNDLAEGLLRAVKESKKLPEGIKERFKEKNDGVQKAIHGIKVAALLASKAAAQMIATNLGMGKLPEANSEKDKAENSASIAENVRELKTAIRQMIEKLSDPNHLVKVVFFVDDLDRVAPPTAVEVLDIPKNIFNIPDCVFVLAIDYEVVVKGLEDKFGPKTPKNEREFRQYFDKIIQIPFTMPTGVYGNKLDGMLKSAFAHLNLNLGEIDQTILDDLAQDARLVTGGNPRSIKRIINTLSLLQHIAGARASKAGKSEQEARLDLLEARFIIVAMYIIYTEICRRLMENPSFTEWQPEKLNLKWKLNLDANKPQLEALAGEDWCNDPWEKTVYCICSQSDWLKSQARNISLLLNKLLKILDPANEPDKPLSEKSQALLQSLLEGIRVVSIDLDKHDVAIIDDSKLKTDRVSVFDQALQNELSGRYPKIIPAWTNEYARKEDRIYEVDMGESMMDIWFEYDKPEEIFSSGVTFSKPKKVKVKETENFLEEYLANYGDAYSCGADRSTFWIYYSDETVTWDDFLVNGQINKQLVSKLADETIKMISVAQKAKEELDRLS